jgi:uncharacterized membrane protein
MDATLSEWLNLLFRWTHVVAGVIWIGHLYFFNWVNAHLAKTYDADSKKKVVPELMPRALYWFRWGAMYTWVSGLFLLELVYFLGGLTGEKVGAGPARGVVYVGIIAAFFIYDFLWKSALAKNEMVGVVVSYLLLAGATVGLALFFPGRTVSITIGALLGTTMFLNVWMRIWPAQKKIIAGIKGTGPAADASVPALAGLRSKHNTYNSVPLILLMLNFHFPTLLTGFSDEYTWMRAVPVLIAVLAGWGVTKLLYMKSGQEATKAIGDAAAAAAPPKAA